MEVSVVPGQSLKGLERETIFSHIFVNGKFSLSIESTREETGRNQTVDVHATEDRRRVVADSTY